MAGNTGTGTCRPRRAAGKYSGGNPDAGRYFYGGGDTDADSDTGRYIFTNNDTPTGKKPGNTADCCYNAA